MTDPKTLLDMFDSFDDDEESVRTKQIVHAPFGYPGGKSRSVKNILPHLPQRDSFIEVFGGSGIVLLNRRPSQLEVYNDRYGGVVSFYRCIRDKDLCAQLVERLSMAPYSKEEWTWCAATWENVEDQVERAARWYYTIQASFAKKGMVWGRVVTGQTIQGRVIQNNLTKFPPVHERMKWVQVENQDWSQCLKDYDNSDAVFYLDPPYLDTNTTSYLHQMSRGDHERMLHQIMNMKGFVALSGYENPLYGSFDWDDRQEWEVFVSFAPTEVADETKAAQRKTKEKEILWIKDAR